MLIQPSSFGAGVALPSLFLILIISFLFSPGPPTPLGADTQDELAATPR